MAQGRISKPTSQRKRKRMKTLLQHQSINNNSMKYANYVYDATINTHTCTRFPLSSPPQVKTTPAWRSEKLVGETFVFFSHVSLSTCCLIMWLFFLRATASVTLHHRVAVCGGGAGAQKHRRALINVSELGASLLCTSDPWGLWFEAQFGSESHRSHDNSSDSSSWSSAGGVEINVSKTDHRTPAVFKPFHHASIERKPLQGLWVFFPDLQTFKDSWRPGSPAGPEVWSWRVWIIQIPL